MSCARKLARVKDNLRETHPRVVHLYRKAMFSNPSAISPSTAPRLQMMKLNRNDLCNVNTWIGVCSRIQPHVSGFTGPCHFHLQFSYEFPQAGNSIYYCLARYYVLVPTFCTCISKSTPTTLWSPWKENKSGILLPCFYHNQAHSRCVYLRFEVEVRELKARQVGLYSGLCLILGTRFWAQEAPLGEQDDHIWGQQSYMRSLISHLIFPAFLRAVGFWRYILAHNGALS